MSDFQVIVGDYRRWMDGESPCIVQVTHNGSQFSTIQLANKSERQAVIKALKDFDLKPTMRRAGK